MSALVLMAGSGSRFSVKASSFESGEMAQSAAAFEREGRHVVGVVGVEIADTAVLDRNQKEMGSLVAGEVVPVAVEEVGEDLRLDLARGQGLIALIVAFGSGAVVVGDNCRAVRIDGCGEDDGFAIGRPLRVVGAAVEVW